jgi:hypothetical protein
MVPFLKDNTNKGDYNMINWEFNNTITYENLTKNYFTSEYKRHPIVKCVTTFTKSSKKQEVFILYCGSFKEKIYSNLNALLRHIDNIAG